MEKKKSNNLHDAHKILTVHLGGVTTSFHADTDVNVLKLFPTNQQNRLKDLVSQSFRLKKLNRIAVNLQQTISLFAVRYRNGVFLQRCAKLKSQFRKNQQEANQWLRIDNSISHGILS